MMRCLFILALSLPSSAQAHSLSNESDVGISTAVLLPLIFASMLYGVGILRLWSRAGLGRGVSLWRVCAFAGGMVQLIGIELSSLPLASQQIFTAHMIEHEIIMVTAAPLLVFAHPLAAMLWACPQSWRRSLGAITSSSFFAMLWRHISKPMPATALHAAVLWAWHAPGLYDSALTQPAVHWLQHASFLLSALLFWHALMNSHAGHGAAIFYLFANTLQSGFLGILLAVAPVPLFPQQSHGAADWGLTALEDQQLAGIIMWVPAGCLYTAAALVFAALWITRSSATAYGR